MADAALPFESYSSRAKDDLQKIAEKRLRPALTDPNFLVLHSRRLIFQAWIAQLPDKALSILDVGGRYQPIGLCLRGGLNATSVSIYCARILWTLSVPAKVCRLLLQAL